MGNLARKIVAALVRMDLLQLGKKRCSQPSLINIYSEVSPIEFHETYSWVRGYRIAALA